MAFLGWMIDGEFVNGQLVGAIFQDVPTEEFLKALDAAVFEVYGVKPK